MCGSCHLWDNYVKKVVAQRQVCRPVPEDSNSQAGHPFSLQGEIVATEHFFTLLIKLQRRQIFVQTNAVTQSNVPGLKTKGKKTVVSVIAEVVEWPLLLVGWGPSSGLM